MKKYLIIDTNHMLHRARHATQGDPWTQVGLALHITLASIRRCWQDFDADHVVFCLEGRSWRKAIYEPYKKNRQTQNNLRKPDQIEADEYFFEVIDEFLVFLRDKTNCTVLQNPIAEADDLIARWCQNHPDDYHIIVSGDTDFIQLLDDNVVMFDGLNNRTLTRAGLLDNKGRVLEFSVKSDGKLKVGKPDPDFMPDDDWPEWATFVKYIRGDSSDNIFSAKPKARITDIKKVYEDRDKQGFEWNNFMLARWVDHHEKEHRVRDVYEQNKELINLTMQPNEVKESLDITIREATDDPKDIKNIGIHFMRFAAKFELKRVLDSKESFVNFLEARYPS